MVPWDTIFLAGTVILAVAMVVSWLRRRETSYSFDFSFDIKDKAAGTWERIKAGVMNLSPKIILIIAVALFFVIPDADNKLKYLAGFIVTYLILGHVLPRIITYNTFYMVNLELEIIGVFDICSLMLPLYSIVDRDGEPAALDYSMWDGHGRAWIVDVVDLKNRIIVVNPITSSVEWTRDYRGAYDDVVSRANRLRNLYLKYKTWLNNKVEQMALDLMERMGTWEEEGPPDELPTNEEEMQLEQEDKNGQ